MFMYWGRRGAMAKFALELGRELKGRADLRAIVSVTRQNESFPEFREFGDTIWPVDTFSTSVGAVTRSWMLPALRRMIHDKIQAERIDAVVNLMPHVWSPFMVSAVQSSGARYATVVHDAVRHPGDHTGLVKPLLDLDAAWADVVFTLSPAVATALRSKGRIDDRKIINLFHPDLAYGVASVRPPPKDGEPFRLLFLGRIMAYKGLPMLLSAVERVRAAGGLIQLSVLGEGDLGASAEQLQRFGATVVNHWLSDVEIEQALAHHHAMVLSHIEASQSGVAAVALGAGLPVIATPAGGIVDQINDGETGVLAEKIDAPALAAAIERLVRNPKLYGQISSAIHRSRGQRSMHRFVQECVRHSVGQ
jgi:glycosyltransferase involved in cell wall biosynthesis